jgi:L-histidine N-alpha-methyltransferase
LPTRRSAILKAKQPSIIRAPELQGIQIFAAAVRQGLLAKPKHLPCEYFYDEKGSRLFEEICRLPEYYLTRVEDAILHEYASAMVADWDQAPVLIELGSGNSSKTRRLISAAMDRYGELHYIPIDVSPTILEESAKALVRAFPGLRVTGYAGDYRQALTSLSARGTRLKCLVFLGSSLGNYETDEAISLLRHMADTMGPVDRLLLGTDLVKDSATLEAAYDDSQGVTGRFNLNLLERINRELGADFRLTQFAHKAIYSSAQQRIEMSLVSVTDQVVHIPAANLIASFAKGEMIHTENSHKYTLEGLHALADRAGFVEEAGWTDSQKRFRVQRWRIQDNSSAKLRPATTESWNDPDDFKFVP